MDMSFYAVVCILLLMFYAYMENILTYKKKEKN